MDDLSFYVGIIGNIISVLVFLSPIGTFYRIVKNKSTEDFESLPYICTLLNSSLWTYYGITKPGAYLVATVNGFGVVVEIIYVILFLIFAPPRMKVRTAAWAGALDIGVFAAALLVTHFLMQGDLRITAIGLMGAALNIVMYGSPLAAMKTVVTTKSVEYMPFFLSFFLFLNGGVWAFYAILVRDPFLGVPNGTGFILGIAQLGLYAIYRNPKTTYTMAPSSVNGLEEGRQHEPLLSSSTDYHQEVQAQV